jgi:hypothetical protein
MLLVFAGILVSILLLALIVAGVWLIGGSVGAQISERQQQLPRAVERLRRLGEP